MTDDPRHRDLSAPALAGGRTVTVTESVAEHPTAFVSDRIYVVVLEGVAVGLETLELNPLGREVQLYELPETELAPSETELPRIIVVLDITAAAGDDLVVITTESVTAHTPLKAL